jgi:hypothetical protein
VFQQLYEEFADRFDLWECKLAIVYCAGLYDSALIESLWKNIIDRGQFSFSSIAIAPFSRSRPEFGVQHLCPLIQDVLA